MVEEASISKLQLCFFDSREGDTNNLVEYFKLKIVTTSDLQVHIHITWAGLGRHEAVTTLTGEGLLRLGKFLTSLPRLKGEWTRTTWRTRNNVNFGPGPMYNSLFFYPNAGRPENLMPGWSFGLEIDAAEHELAQKPLYSTCLVTSLR